jgi:2-amino-4-hydroxy-6-hydroxymethyldihydropteridine diphosphokinase
MWQRAFVLVPLAEIAPDKVSAVALQTISGQAICRLAGQSGFAV